MILGFLRSDHMSCNCLSISGSKIRSHVLYMSVILWFWDQNTCTVTVSESPVPNHITCPVHVCESPVLRWYHMYHICVRISGSEIRSHAYTVYIYLWVCDQIYMSMSLRSWDQVTCFTSVGETTVLSSKSGKLNLRGFIAICSAKGKRIYCFQWSYRATFQLR